jgi:hypothetical protein
MASRKDQLSRASSTQKEWATLAENDAHYNRQQAARDTAQGNPTLAHMHNMEADWDEQWAKRRLRIAKHPEKFY